MHVLTHTSPNHTRENRDAEHPARAHCCTDAFATRMFWVHAHERRWRCIQMACSNAHTEIIYTPSTSGSHTLQHGARRETRRQSWRQQLLPPPQPCDPHTHAAALRCTHCTAHTPRFPALNTPMCTAGNWRAARCSLPLQQQQAAASTSALALAAHAPPCPAEAKAFQRAAAHTRRSRSLSAAHLCAEPMRTNSSSSITRTSLQPGMCSCTAASSAAPCTRCSRESGT